LNLFISFVISMT